MKNIIILLSSMFLLVGCIESVALLGTSSANGKLVQSSLKSGVSLGIKKTKRKNVAYLLLRKQTQKLVRL